MSAPSICGESDNGVINMLIRQDDNYTESYISTIGVDFVSASDLCASRQRTTEDSDY